MFRLLLAIFSTTCAVVAAWSSTGHMIVATIGANSIMNPETLTRLNRILQQPTGVQCQTPPTLDVVDAAPWMDDIKHCTHEYDAWHYVDAEVDAPFTLSASPNVVTAIQEAMTAPNQSFNLHVLTHLVGDIHQPLHCANRNNDRGGNDFVLNGHHNLHSLWDTGLGMFSHDLPRPLSSAHADYLQGWADKVQTQYPANESPMKERLQKTNIEDWARESHDIARDHVYVGIFPHTTPEKRYLEENEAIVHQQLAVAGYRLADLLIRWR